MKPEELSLDSPFAISDLLFGLSSLRDSEGRPVGERRAPSDAKAGVEMVLKPCPYHDSRKGEAMNVSALAQITRHLGSVLDDIAAFRQAQPAPASNWRAAFGAVIDQLFAPGRDALDSLRVEGHVRPTPAPLAVGHKLAAGYFGVVSALLKDELSGQSHPFSVDHFLEYVTATRALHGASEVCGGPPNMIERATVTLLTPDSSNHCAADYADRIAVADLLAEQIICGLEYQLLDHTLEYRLFELLGSEVHCRNHFIAEQYQCRQRELEHARSLGQRPALPAAGRRKDALESPSLEHLPNMLEPLLSDGRGVLLVSSERAPGVVHIARTLLIGYQRAVLAQEALEADLRARLGLPTTTGRPCNSLLLPHGRTQRWLEALAGASLRTGPALELTLNRIQQPSVVLTPDLCDDVPEPAVAS